MKKMCIFFVLFLSSCVFFENDVKRTFAYYEKKFKDHKRIFDQVENQLNTCSLMYFPNSNTSNWDTCLTDTIPFYKLENLLNLGKPFLNRDSCIRFNVNENPLIMSRFCNISIEYSKEIVTENYFKYSPNFWHKILSNHWYVTISVNSL